jgi:hypothetical protein
MNEGTSIKIRILDFGKMAPSTKTMPRVKPIILDLSSISFSVFYFDRVLAHPIPK